MRVPIASTADDLLFGRRTFSKILNEGTRTIQISESHAIFVGAQSLNDLLSYADYVKGQRDWKNELALQEEEKAVQVEAVDHALDSLECYSQETN